MMERRLTSFWRIYPSTTIIQKLARKAAEKALGPRRTLLHQPRDAGIANGAIGADPPVVTSMSQCVDPLVGKILAGWRYDISGLAPEMRGDYEHHLPRLRTLPQPAENPSHD